VGGIRRDRAATYLVRPYRSEPKLLSAQAGVSKPFLAELLKIQVRLSGESGFALPLFHVSDSVDAPTAPCARLAFSRTKESQAFGAA
jgi:hypothetical protein